MKYKQLQIELPLDEFELMERLSDIWRLDPGDIIRFWIRDHAPGQIRNPSLVNQAVDELLEKGLLIVTKYGPDPESGKIEPFYRTIRPGDYGLSEEDWEKLVKKNEWLSSDDPEPRQLHLPI
jgi:hypothetical protein